MEKYLSETNDVMVSIHCMAYNHEKYISKTLDSILSQKVNFKYEVLIHDDASTDKTADIIKKYVKEYPEIIKPIFQTENQYSQGKKPAKRNLLRAKGKYIAICEGDDYWTDDNKLQKQVDFLERNPDFSLCVHSGMYINENGDFNGKYFKAYNEDTIVPVEDMIKRWLFPTASIIYRKSAREPFEIPFGEKAVSGDFRLLLYLALKGKVYYFEKSMCVYRRDSVSSLTKASTSVDEKRYSFLTGFVSMMNEFDTYTNNVYHEVINAHDSIKTYLEFHIAVRDGNIEVIKSERCIEIYKNCSIRKKISIHLIAYTPHLHSLLKSIKNELRKVKILHAKYK